MHEHTAERWLPVVGWEHRGYEVSNQGQVRNARGKLHSLSNHGRGYRSVGLWDGEKVRTKLVHHLVLEAFVGPRPDGMEALHADDDHANNRVENLRWGTKFENVQDKIRNGMTHNGGKGKSMTPDQVRAIRKRIDEGLGLKAIGEEFGILPCSVWAIKVGRYHSKVA